MRYPTEWANAYFRSLGASWAEVQRGYRARVVECHPDRIATTGMTSEEAHARLKDVNAAYVVLKVEFGK